MIIMLIFVWQDHAFFTIITIIILKKHTDGLLAQKEYKLAYRASGFVYNEHHSGTPQILNLYIFVH